MTAPEPDGIVWRTSSYSGNGGDCVQVAPASDRVLVRDSKNPDGPALAVPAVAWRVFRTPTGGPLSTSPRRDRAGGTTSSGMVTARDRADPVGEGSFRVSPSPTQPDSGNPYAPMDNDETSGTGAAFVVDRDEVLSKRAALLAGAADFRAFLNRIWEELFMEPMGGDPVSHDVARAVTYRMRDAEDSYFNVC